VEESGSLTELGYLIDDYGKGYFDVLHLTGHATITANGNLGSILKRKLGTNTLPALRILLKSCNSAYLN
jgi:hypothetical protein